MTRPTFKPTVQRTVLGCALAAAAVAAAASVVQAAPEAARSADAFIDSIGINTHYGNAGNGPGNAYANPLLDTKLTELGIGHLRDHTWSDIGLTRIDGLYSAYGIRTNLILGETTRSPAQLVDLLKQHPGYEAIEGLNEPDGQSPGRTYTNASGTTFVDVPSANDYAATRAFQNDLYAAVRADALLSPVRVLSPAMGNSSRSQFLVGTGFDVAAMHHYSDGREPTFGLSTALTNMNTLRGAPPKPLIATESGYFNQPFAQTGSIPETISGQYMPRLYAEYFNSGISRTYAYELVDQGPSTANREENFGLLRFDMSEKPAFVAMKNVIHLLEEPGADFVPGSLDYTLSSASDISQVHHTLLQKSDGTFYLLLWQEEPAYNRFAESEIINPALAVTLTLNQPIDAARTYLPNLSLTPTATYAVPATIDLSVPDQMLIVELSVPEPGATGAALGGWAAISLLRRRRIA
jgi:hypothetical protein